LASLEDEVQVARQHASERFDLERRLSETLGKLEEEKEKAKSAEKERKESAKLRQEVEKL